MEAREWAAELGRAICAEPGVQFAVAFGSAVDGPWTPSSDIDVAVKFVDALSPTEQFRRLCSLSGNVQRSDAPFVDVSNVETLPLPVARRAVGGEFVCGDESAFRRYRATIEDEYGDRREEITQHRRDVIDRIARGGLRG